MALKLVSGTMTKSIKGAGVEDIRKKPSTRKFKKAKKTREKPKSRCGPGMKLIGGKCRKVTRIIGRDTKLKNKQE
jgi:hypothetical protein